jgi:hypothetical protein
MRILMSSFFWGTRAILGLAWKVPDFGMKFGFAVRHHGLCDYRVCLGGNRCRQNLGAAEFFFCIIHYFMTN